MERENKHKCHAIGCQNPVPPTMFMCPKHWYSLPKNLQKKIWLYYRPGQEVDKDPSQEYLDTANEAKEYVYAREHKVD